MLGGWAHGSSLASQTSTMITCTPVSLLSLSLSLSLCSKIDKFDFYRWSAPVLIYNERENVVIMNFHVAQ